MDEIIQIKCPFDGAVLSVKYQAGIESKNVTCPICKNKYPFSQFRRVTPKSNYDEPSTQYPHGDEHTSYGEEHTSYMGQGNSASGMYANYTLGKVSIAGSNCSYQLRSGRNVIGRKAQASSADWQINTGEKRSLSREHLVIEVKKVPSKGFVHYVSLYKEKVNKTYIGNEPLYYGDCIVLNHGDLLKLPDVTLLFEIPDEDNTQF